ncbi:IQ calmodulin-binding motif-containing protein 1-like [Ruditapes philippinarum]|uniref:IQ calmodulin-binding motif-containing protein 1-like n=1 Tax=Ruditapes philippinarum TaxID=129788 RepID=UPI00295B7AAF|nr:IQ calmodulin-binding motif-containing protein 1-like [Ruditapes philippinarum]
MSRGTSPVRDKRIIHLAAEVVETRDRRVPVVLQRLKPILDTSPATSSDGVRIRREIWEFQLLDVLILVLKQDYSVIEGQWLTAARLTTILSQAVSGLDIPKEDMKDVENNKLPEAIHNMFLVARRIQARFAQIPKRPSKEEERQFHLRNYKTVLDSLIYLASGYISVTHKVLSSPWLLQLLILDNEETVAYILDLIPKVLRANWLAIKEVNIKTVYSIMDELIYKLSVESSVILATGAVKCILCICEYHKPMVAALSTRYRGLRLLLARWEDKGFSRDLKSLHRLLDAGNAQRAEMEKNYDSAVMIQANWKGYITRRKLARANKSFAKFQKAFRNRRKVKEETMTRQKHQSEVEYKGLVNRQRIMREFRERQLHCIEILPASKVEKYLENEQIQAATKIQKLWRGHIERHQLTGRRDLVRQTRAAIKIQQTVRRWLERLENRKGKMPLQLLPPGLTDDRRVELQKTISNYREENPPKAYTRGELETVHKKATALLSRYYGTVRESRKAEQRRQTLLARLDTDSDLCALAPDLNKVTQRDVDMYSSRSVPVATKARVSHMETLRNLQLPWWKKLGDEFQDSEIQEEEVLLF